jgi:hypothetical protein
MRCDAVELGRVDGDRPEERVRTIPAPVRRAVLARDHNRCTVPGCRSAMYVDVHRIRYRSRGGDNAMQNLTTLCCLHHDLVHQGRITISGTATNLTITHADGRPYGALPPPEPPPSAPSTPASHVGHAATAALNAGAAPLLATVIADARRALTRLGFRPAEAACAVERAMTQAGNDVTLEALIRASLRECPRPCSM